MVVIIALIISGLLAWLGVKKGVYTMAATLFNILISIYIGMLSTPLVLRTSPGLEESGYYAAFCMLFLVVACFVLLQGICYYFFLRGADIVFPDLFDKVAGALFGFASGYIVMGILVLAVCMMPFSRLDVVQKYVSWESLHSFCLKTTAGTCHFVGAWSLEYLEDQPEETIDYLVKLGWEDTEEAPVDFEIKSLPPAEGGTAPAVPEKPAEETEPVPERPRRSPDPLEAEKNL